MDDVNVHVGDEQIYRLRDYAPSRRVLVLAIHMVKKNMRCDVKFLDGDNVGTVENVPSRRLRGPWAEVTAFDELWANWERLDQYELTEFEQDATERVFSLLIPSEVAQREWSPIRHATSVFQPAILENLIGIPAADLVSHIDSFVIDEKMMVSVEGTVLVAEYACRVNPMPVLEWVISDEAEYREKTKHGQTYRGSDNRSTMSSPEWEYQWYVERVRPVHELLRSWCGQRAVTMNERLAAAEAEMQRLDMLVGRLIDELKSHNHSMVADIIAQAHSEERITPANFRPVVDRPLKPSEIPIRYERGPRRWGY